MAIKKKQEEEVSLLTQAEDIDTQPLTRPQRKRNISILAINSFFMGSANVIYYILYAPYFREINSSERLFGIVGTLASVIALIGLIASDYLNGLIGFKRSLIIAQILIFSSFAFFIFRPAHIAWIIVAVLLLNFAFALSESPGTIILTETAGDSRKGRISSLTSFFGRLGDVIVAAILVAITFIISADFEEKLSNVERSYFFSYSAGIYLVVAILTILFIADPLKIRKTEEYIKPVTEINKTDVVLEEYPVIEQAEIDEQRVEEKKSNFFRGFIEAFKDKWVLRVALTFFFDATIWSIGLGVYWAAMTDPDLLGPYALIDQDISILSLISSIIVLLGMFPTGWLVDKIGAKILLFSSEICGFAWAICAVIFVFFPHLYWLLILSRVAIGLSIVLWIPSTIALFTNVESKRKSKVYNSIAIFRTIGWLPGGMIAGLLYEAIPQPYGFLTPIFILITGLFVLIPLFFTLANRPPQNNNTKNVAQEIK
ncbi:MAG: MFS transporter [Asgard group archaeon]|nr:MFS transporter [Asgard group archaeon]